MILIILFVGWLTFASCFVRSSVGKRAGLSDAKFGLLTAAGN